MATPRKPRTAPENYPYRDHRVPIFCWYDGGWLSACTVEEKITLLDWVQSVPQDARPTVLSVWPGMHRSDLFYVKPRIALESLLRKA